MKQSERQVLDRFITKYLQEHLKAKVWVEVPVHGIGTADVVWLDGQNYYIGEGKAAKPSFELLAQCLRWQRLCNGVCAIYPSQPLSEASLLAEKAFARERVDIYCVGDFVRKVVSGDRVWGDGIASFLRDSQLYGGQFAAAGTAGGKRGTRANEEYLAIEEWITEHPNCRASQAAKEHGLKAMKLLKLIKDGHVNAITENRGGVTYLLPVDKGE